MPSAPSEEPEGLVLRPQLLTAAEEAGLLERLDDLRFDPIVMHGRAARRTARHYGLGYDYESRTPKPGEPIPDWVLPVRRRAAELAGEEPDALVEALVQRYPPGATIGWHRDAPAFGAVVGVSLGTACRLRFQRGSGERSPPSSVRHRDHAPARRRSVRNVIEWRSCLVGGIECCHDQRAWPAST